MRVDDIADLARSLQLPLSPGQLGQLDTYLEQLQRWNATYNLTAIREPQAMFTQHLADCLAVVPAITRHRQVGRLMDVGSGGGLPGVIVACALPDWQVACIDTVAKKAAFVRQMAGLLKLPNLQAIHTRVEHLKPEPWDLITSRAFSSLLDFTSLTRRHLAADGVWMAMKGKVPDEEMAALPEDVDVFHVEQLVVPGLDAQRCLVWMRPRR